MHIELERGLVSMKFFHLYEKANMCRLTILFCHLICRFHLFKKGAGSMKFLICLKKGAV